MLTTQKKSSLLYLSHSDVNVPGFLFTAASFPAIPLLPIVCEILKCRNQVYDLWVSTFWAHSRYFTNKLKEWVPMDTSLERDTS